MTRRHDAGANTGCLLLLPSLPGVSSAGIVDKEDLVQLLLKARLNEPKPEDAVHMPKQHGARDYTVAKTTFRRQVTLDTHPVSFGRAYSCTLPWTPPAAPPSPHHLASSCRRLPSCRKTPPAFGGQQSGSSAAAPGPKVGHLG